MPYSRRSSDSEPEYVLMPVRSHAGSEFGGRSRRDGDGRRSPTVVNNYLGVPQQARPRSSSTGGGVQPTIVNIGALPSEHGRSRSRSRHRHHSRHSRSRSSSSSGSSRSRSRRRSHHESKTRRPLNEEDLPYTLRKDIDYARQSRKDDEERRIQERLKKAREDEKKRWTLEEEEERIRKKKEREDEKRRWTLEEEEERIRKKKEREDEKRRWALEEEEERIRKKKEREAILFEAKLEEEKKQKAAEELKKKILQDEEERVKKEKEKKKAEEEEFERKVKEKFMKAGYSSEYVEEVLHKKKEEQAMLAIDLHRPTFIKVNRKYLHPDTLDAYGLPWEWDVRDSEYIIIKKYIDHGLQDELFEHTRKMKERKLITGPYVKETKTITTLTPNEFVKRGDKMYVVREKSKSPASRSRRSSWMFT